MKIRYLRSALACFAVAFVVFSIRVAEDWDFVSQGAGLEPREATAVLAAHHLQNTDERNGTITTILRPNQYKLKDESSEETSKQNIAPTIKHSEPSISARKSHSQQQERTEEKSRDSAITKRKILVILSKSPVGGPGPRETRMAAILDTWGQHISVVFLTLNSTHDTASLKQRGIHNMELWQLPTKDHVERFSQPRAMQYAFTKAATEKNLQWIFWGNDHTFVIPGNLQCFLEQHDANEYHYLGHRLNGPCCGDFNSGAAGFAVSRRAFDVLVNHWADAPIRHEKPVQVCDFTRKGSELAPCLKTLTHGACVPADTRDPHDGAEKFHLYGVVRVARGAIDEWAKRKKKSLSTGPEYYPDSPSLRCCSRHTISFHYVAADETRALYAALHELNSSQRAKLSSLDWANRWPDARRLGGYSSAWPRRKKSEAALLSEVLGKKIEVLSPKKCTADGEVL